MKTQTKKLYLLGGLLAVFASMVGAQIDYSQLQGRLLNPGSFDLDSSSPSGMRTVSAADTPLIVKASAATTKGMVLKAGDAINIYFDSGTEDINTSAAALDVKISDGTTIVASGPVAVSSQSKASAQLTVLEDYAIPAGEAASLKVYLNTDDLMAEDSGQDDELKVTFSYALKKVTGYLLKY